MKVIIFNIKIKPGRKTINKDLAGGMGTGTWVGDSFLARVFERVKKANVVLPELALAYVLAIFKKAGWEAKVVEGENVDDFSEKADLILVPVSIVDCAHEREAIIQLKEKGYYIGVYGTFASAVPEFFSGCADFVIKGEPEAGILKIINDGLPKGIVVVSPVEDLDSLPYPDWDQFPVKKYSYSPALNKKPVLLMLSSRGCPYSCAFYCPYPINSGRKYRMRSVKNVVDEMEFLKKRYSVKAIDFRDPIFTLDRQRTADLCNEIIKRELGLVWSCETRTDCLDKELLVLMKRAGLHHINIGVESFSEDVLKNSKRLPIAAKKQEEIISFCHKNKITVAAFYIIGMENDTENIVRQTIDYAKKLNTLVAQFTISTPFPGTMFFEQMKKEGRIESFDWKDYDTYNPVFRHKFLSPEDMLKLKEQAFVGYYFRPKYLFSHMPRYFLEKFVWRY